MRAPNADYPAERVLPGAMHRLLTEDWSNMTQAARAADNHPKNLARWEKIIRDAGADLDAGQVVRLAEMLRTQHYQRLGKLSAQARRIAAAAVEELAGLDERA